MTQHTIEIIDDSDARGMRFEPESLTIAVGDSVVWHNADDEDHSAVRTQAPAFDTDIISPGDTSTPPVVFSAANPSVKYICGVHGSMMTGYIVVTA